MKSLAAFRNISWNELQECHPPESLVSIRIDVEEIGSIAHSQPLLQRLTFLTLRSWESTLCDLHTTLVQCSNLRHLTIVTNVLSDWSFLHHLHHLKSMQLHITQGITDETAAAINRQVPTVCALSFKPRSFDASYLQKICRNLPKLKEVMLNSAPYRVYLSFLRLLSDQSILPLLESIQVPYIHFKRALLNDCGVQKVLAKRPNCVIKFIRHESLCTVCAKSRSGSFFTEPCLC